MRLLIDLGPLALFVLTYQFAGGIYPATAVLIVSLYVALALDYALTRRLNKMLAGGAVLATVLGGLTFALHDPSFIKLKPTLIYAAFALALLGSHFVGKQVLMQRLAGTALSLPDPIWRRLNVAWALFFAFCAGLNWFVAHHYSESTWVRFKFSVFTVLPFVFAIAQTPFLLRYLPDEPTDGNAPPAP